MNQTARVGAAQTKHRGRSAPTPRLEDAVQQIVAELIDSMATKHTQRISRVMVEMRERGALDCDRKGDEVEFGRIQVLLDADRIDETGRALEDVFNQIICRAYDIGMAREAALFGGAA